MIDTKDSKSLLQEIIKIFIVAVVLLIVSIPEGMPVAVSIAMAMSVNRMKKD